RSVGRTQGSVQDRIAQLKQEPAYPLTEGGRRQIIAAANAILCAARTRPGAQLRQQQAYTLRDVSRQDEAADANAILGDARTRAAAQFDRMPNAPVEVRPFPRFREANAAANYTAPPADG